MRIKCICCDVFTRIACAAVAASPHIVDLEFVPMLAHTEPDKLRADLQARIDRSTQTRPYNRIVLGYGLCGNATSGLHGAVPLVIPRVHDCCTMFLGDRARFTEIFGDNLSMRWSCCGYFERCHIDGFADTADYKTSLAYVKLLDEYGEENADYIWETMHPPIETTEAVYITMAGYEHSDSQAGFARQVAEAGKTLITAEGDASWLFRLINGPWHESDFLTVNPGEWVCPVYDMREVMRAE